MTLYTSSFNDHNYWPVISHPGNHLFISYNQNDKSNPNLYPPLSHSLNTSHEEIVWGTAENNIFILFAQRKNNVFKFLSCNFWRFCRGHSSLASFSTVWIRIPLQQHDCHISVWRTASSDFHRKTWGPIWNKWMFKPALWNFCQWDTVDMPMNPQALI